MKKGTFIPVMIAEVLADLLAMGLLFSDVGALIYPISLALFAAVLAPFYLGMKKAPEEAGKRKFRLWMVLIMLIPMLVAVAAIAYLLFGLFLYYGF